MDDSDPGWDNSCTGSLVISTIEFQPFRVRCSTVHPRRRGPPRDGSTQSSAPQMAASNGSLHVLSSDKTQHRCRSPSPALIHSGRIYGGESRTQLEFPFLFRDSEFSQLSGPGGSAGTYCDPANASAVTRPAIFWEAPYSPRMDAYTSVSTIPGECNPRCHLTEELFSPIGPVRPGLHAFPRQPGRDRAQWTARYRRARAARQHPLGIPRRRPRHPGQHHLSRRLVSGCEAGRPCPRLSEQSRLPQPASQTAEVSKKAAGMKRSAVSKTTSVASVAECSMALDNRGTEDRKLRRSTRVRMSGPGKGRISSFRVPFPKAELAWA